MTRDLCLLLLTLTCQAFENKKQDNAYTNKCSYRIKHKDAVICYVPYDLLLECYHRRIMQTFVFTFHKNNKKYLKKESEAYEKHKKEFEENEDDDLDELLGKEKRVQKNPATKGGLGRLAREKGNTYIDKYGIEREVEEEVEDSDEEEYDNHAKAQNPVSFLLLHAFSVSRCRQFPAPWLFFACVCGDGVMFVQLLRNDKKGHGYQGVQSTH